MRTSSVPAPVLMVTAIMSVQFGAALAQTQSEVVGPTGATLLRLIFGALILLVAARPKVSDGNGISGQPRQCWASRWLE